MPDVKSSFFLYTNIAIFLLLLFITRKKLYSRNARIVWDKEMFYEFRKIRHSVITTRYAEFKYTVFLPIRQKTLHKLVGSILRLDFIFHLNLIC